LNELAELIGYIAIVFAFSFSASYLLVRLTQRKRLANNPPLGPVQISSGSAMYRSRFIREENGHWVLAAPLSRDSYVPLRVGEMVSIQAVAKGGVYRFRAEIASRDAETHQFAVRAPDALSLVERRDNPRLTFSPPEEARVEGDSAWLQDLSPLGARVLATIKAPRGERVRLDLSNTDEPVFAWVLDCAAAPAAHNAECLMRLRFEEAFPLQTYKKAAPV
jgi:hypothetical protein